MKLYTKPDRKDWTAILKRPAMDAAALEPVVTNILNEVKVNGDEAVRKFSLMFDKTVLSKLELEQDEIDFAANALSEELKRAIHLAASNIGVFHKRQMEKEEFVETMPGVLCWRKSVPIDKVGLYIPGGTAPLFSTLLMLGIPAALAGCKEIILCSPPTTGGTIHPAILYAAKVAGITKVFRVGGVQAIGAMAYGTTSIPQVYKIFGPGNQYVTCAKQLIQKAGIAIDIPAGPSEVAVYADDSANPSFVAADLLSQAEHGIDSQVMLVCISPAIAEKVKQEIERQLENLPRKQIAVPALNNSKIILVKDEEQAMDLLNEYAPEHLILASNHARELSGKVRNAGSVFLGHFSPESVGDYASGTNHTLPTNGYAKSYSGVSLDSFVKKITFQELTKQGLMKIGKSVEHMAEAEGMDAHALAVRLRRESINNE